MTAPRLVRRLHPRPQHVLVARDKVGAVVDAQAAQVGEEVVRRVVQLELAAALVDGLCGGKRGLVSIAFISSVQQGIRLRSILSKYRRYSKILQLPKHYYEKYLN